MGYSNSNDITTAYNDCEILSSSLATHCIKDIKQNELSLKYVKEQTPEICLETVKTKWIDFGICERTNREDLFGGC